MLGAEKATPELVERLTRETEGNALFIVEVMRALAEEAGSLHNITHHSLPARILASGMVAILRRRLSKVPVWALETLKLAAIVGRLIDLPVLKAAGIADLDTWLQTCAEAAVLEPYSGEWRFSHDRLREVLLQDLAELATLHEKAARAIEAVYGDNVNYAEALAQHWRIAGNAEREVHFILKAAEQLLEFSGAYARAESLLKRGLDLNLAHTRIELLMWLGLTEEKQAHYDEAIDYYQTALTDAALHPLYASLLNKVGNSFRLQSKYPEAADYAQRARVLAEETNDQRNIAASFSILGIVARSQGNYQAARTYHENSLYIQRAIGNWQGVARSLSNLGTMMRNQGDYQAAHIYHKDSLHIFQEIGDRIGTSNCLNNLGVTAINQGDYTAASTYFEDCLRIRREIGDPWGIASSLSNLGLVALNQDNIQAARTYQEESLRIRREIGDRRGIASNLENLGTLAFYQEDYQAARAAYEESLTICREIGARNIAGDAMAGLIMVLVQLGEREVARQTLIDALHTSQELNAPPLMLLVLLGAASWSQDNQRAAEWIGLMLEQGDALLRDDIELKRLSNKLCVALGNDVYNLALERGKSLDVHSVIASLLAELEPTN
jgi:tetratricopeptide (TPR) repeat protein